MSDFSDFQAQIKEWANRQDWSDGLVTSFIRMAEQKLNAELRIDRMIKWVDGVINERGVPLPDDWLSTDLVRMESSLGADGFLPIRYLARDHFFNLTDIRAENYYTMEGRTIFFGGLPPPGGRGYQVVYFAEVPVFSDTQDSWVYDKHPSLYLQAALMHADLHAIGEEDKAAMLKQLVEDQIVKLNAGFQASRASGSRVTRSRVRTFG